MLLVSAAILSTVGSAQMQAPLWRGIDTVAVKCAPAAQAGVSCADIVAGAGRDAPLKVVAWHEGMDRQPSVGTLILSVRFDSDARGRAMLISAMRAVSIDDAEGGLLPRRFAWCDAAGRAACGDRLEHALDRILPWRRRQARAQDA